MLYEPWIETAEGYNHLRDRLKERGYSNIPMGENPMLNFSNYEQMPKANTKNIKIIQTMIRKQK